MNQSNFTRQMDRLCETFGATKYKSERIALIWKEIKDLSDEWFRGVIDKFIGECSQPPLLPEFREEIAKERERLYRIQKKKQSQEAKEFFRSSYQPDDLSTICQTIMKRLQGGVGDQEYSSFQKMLNNVSESAPDQICKCKKCEDSGLIFHREDGYEWVYRCTCSTGAMRPNTYMTYQ